MTSEDIKHQFIIITWAFRPNEPYGFRGRKATPNHAYALVTVCP